MNSSLQLAILVLIPSVLLLGAWWSGLPSIKDSTRRIITRSTSIALLLSLVTVTVSFVTVSTSGTWLSVNAASLSLIALVSFMAVILLRFSERYIRAEKNAHSYWRWMLLSLTSVSVVILSNHLVLFWLGWVAISLCFHRLLLFYPDRPRAVLAAHKKFILARVAELCLLGAFALLFVQHQTFQIDEIVDYYLQLDSATQLSFAEKAAAFLLAQTALIKCAQLPLHGWLIQVVEAPTPISALLHAGIINLGGYLLISFAPLLSHAPIAQWTLIVVAGLSTLLCALVMTTRISIKVRLAWSTSAQMGLMLVECALGLYELALLHLLTHSLYKAYAFLSTGDVVQDYVLKQLAPVNQMTITTAVMSMFIAAGCTLGLYLFTDYQGPMSPWLLISLAMSVYLMTALNTGVASVLTSMITVVLMLLFYMLGKSLVTLLLPELTSIQAFHPIDLWLSMLVTALFVLAMQIRLYPNLKQTQTLYRWLFSGFYLDEMMTRLTLLLWPVELRPKQYAVKTSKPLSKEYSA